MNEARDPTPSEWLALHEEDAGYERLALLIKLAALVAWLGAWRLGLTWQASLVVALLWGQEAIWRTWQARIGERLIALERGDAAPFRLYSDWAERRGGVTALLRGYLCNAPRPTVLYPYAPLLLVDAARQWLF